MGERRETRVRSLVAVGILSALVFVFSWVQVPFGDVARIHLGNGFCALAGLLFGPVTGGLASGIGSMPVSYTHLDVYKRQGRRSRPFRRGPRGTRRRA